MTNVIVPEVQLIVPGMKQYELSSNWEWDKESILTIEPGTYTLSFEGFLQEREYLVSGEEMIRRANESGIDGNIQHALWLLENQHLIPKEFRSKYLVFPKAVALVFNVRRRVAFLYWNGGQWCLGRLWLERDFGRIVLLVRARKSK